METRTLAEIGTVITGKTPSTSHDEYYGGDYMFVTPSELHGEYVVTSSAKTLTSKGMESIRNNTISGNSILVGCIGWDMGNVAMCRSHCATNQQINSITQLVDCVNPAYLYYWLSTKKDYLFSIASVTRTPILSKSVFEQIAVPLPSKEKQDKVVRVLEGLDKAISLNRQINDNLPVAA